jgi:hypothetical protein
MVKYLTEKALDLLLSDFPQLFSSFVGTKCRLNLDDSSNIEVGILIVAFAAIPHYYGY